MPWETTFPEDINLSKRREIASFSRIEIEDSDKSPLRRKKERAYEAMKNTAANLRSYKTMEVLTDTRNYKYLLNMNHGALDNFCILFLNE